ncbi:putative potassium transporter 3 [Hibiscus syriacus]|uniref:Potassium transporter n=1 Tax=Hibiscus syriacus TaxID=106335 RepID=A0A6A3C534_HIBSY|nr:putative potassium transporter 3 [Hibiscus syriacus]
MIRVKVWHAKFSLLPNQQAADEELSAYKYGPSTQATGSPLKRFLEKHKRLRTALLVVVLFGAAMVIGDGVLTPAISGLKNLALFLNLGELVVLACVILVGLFALRHVGTHRVAFMFAPIVIIWLVSNFSIGLYNIIHWNPKIVHAISPYYIINFFRETGKDGWISLGGILLSVTGTEAMFADVGQFTALSIRLAFAFAFVVYPCLVVQYMGQAAFLSRNLEKIPNSFYDSIPGSAYWPVFLIATLAAIVGSRAIITATFSIIKQCHALGCFPRVKVVYTSKHIFGQIYIPEINWILMILTLAITIGFQDTTLIGNAYGLACITVMFTTTFLMALVVIFVWQKGVWLAAVFLAFFWLCEGVYLSAALMKVPQGGWVPLVLSVIFMMVMYIWHYGIRKKYNFDMHNKVSLRWLLGLGPSLGIMRVPGIGLIYSELATGVPAIFSHFVTNLPAFHKVLVFICVKSVPVPYVHRKNAFLLAGYAPGHILAQSIAEFIQMEAGEPQVSSSESSSYDGRLAVIVKRRHVKFEVASSLGMGTGTGMREELIDLIEAKEAGVACIMGHSEIFKLDIAEFRCWNINLDDWSICTSS